VIDGTKGLEYLGTRLKIIVYHSPDGCICTWAFRRSKIFSGTKTPRICVRRITLVSLLLLALLEWGMSVVAYTDASLGFTIKEPRGWRVAKIGPIVVFMPPDSPVMKKGSTAFLVAVRNTSGTFEDVVYGLKVVTEAESHEFRTIAERWRNVSNGLPAWEWEYCHTIYNNTEAIRTRVKQVIVPFTRLGEEGVRENLIFEFSYTAPEQAYFDHVDEFEQSLSTFALEESVLGILVTPFITVFLLSSLSRIRVATSSSTMVHRCT